MLQINDGTRMFASSGVPCFPGSSSRRRYTKARGLSPQINLLINKTWAHALACCIYHLVGILSAAHDEKGVKNIPNSPKRLQSRKDHTCSTDATRNTSLYSYPLSGWGAILTEYNKVPWKGCLTSSWRARPSKHLMCVCVWKRLFCQIRSRQRKKCWERSQKWWTTSSYPTPQIISSARPMPRKALHSPVNCVLGEICGFSASQVPSLRRGVWWIRT